MDIKPDQQTFSKINLKPESRKTDSFNLEMLIAQSSMLNQIPVLCHKSNNAKYKKNDESNVSFRIVI